MKALHHSRIELNTKRRNKSKPAFFSREFIAVLIVVANIFVWYTLIYVFLIDMVKNLIVTELESLEIFVFFYVSIAISAILNPFLSKKFTAHSFLAFCFLFGAFATALLWLFDMSTPTSAFTVSSILGFSIGISLPSALAYFADNIDLENRGKAGGIIWLLVGFGTLTLAVLSNTIDTSIAILMLTILRISGLLFFFFEPKLTVNLKKDYSYFAILRDSRILLYLVPWIMFCLINWIESPIVEQFLRSQGMDFTFITFVELVISGVFAFVGGFFSDIVGRKRIIIIGFIMLGIEYSVLSFFGEIAFFRYLYILLDGISWGMFAAVFFIILWGDLVRDAIKERYYVIGGLPYLLAGFLGIFVGQHVASIPVNSAFSLASFFLFLAILPLIYASETLPEKKIQERQLRKYAEVAKKIAEKETKT